LEKVLESLPYPFYVIDAKDYTIKMANSAARLGSISEDSTCYALTHKRSRPCRGAEHTCPLEEVKKTKKPATAEHIHYDKDGNVRNVEIHGYPIFDNNGNIIQMIEYSLDITERKRAEEERIKAAVDKQRLEQLEKFTKIAVGRELKMIELKKRIEELESKLKEKS